MNDDWDYGYDIEREREEDYEREMAITHWLEDRERDEEDRIRRDRAR